MKNVISHKPYKIFTMNIRLIAVLYFWYLSIENMGTIPPSAAIVVLRIINSMSGQSSDWFAYLVDINPTASKPTDEVKGPSSFIAYLKAVFRFTSRFKT